MQVDDGVDSCCRVALQAGSVFEVSVDGNTHTNRSLGKVPSP